ncbi:sugar phosphate nucleotidyltransferase [Rheinheimera sp.]|uniref:sugar phosphate nucleotidyltransferase n=1 Tax=Rheinheimera sp. TaxID=1869214 RepID=UPI004047C9C1
MDMVNNLKTAVILAGGMGTRLRSVVTDRPKPMALVSGRPFLEHLLRYWSERGVVNFILSVGYLKHCIQDYFGQSFEGAQIDYVIEHKPLGTGGGLLLCQREYQMTSPFLLLNGDTYFAIDPNVLNKQSCRLNADWGFSLFPTFENNRYLSSHVDQSGFLSFAKSTPRKSKSFHWANGGVYWVNPRALKPFITISSKLSLEEELFPKCRQIGQTFCGIKSYSTFIDIGVPNDYDRAQKISFSSSSI